MHAILPLAIGFVALLYASVGHAGATGYIAVMTLLGMPSAVVRPTALLLNVIVAMIASVQFIRAGHFRPQLFWPLAVASVPCAFVGGTLTLPTAAFEAVLGGVLLGLIESLGAGYIGDLTGGFLGSQYQDIFAFIVLILVLTLRPQGLLGERVADRS
jgi:branched-subunit amino acid ABC-type transport system permease component